MSYLSEYDQVKQFTEESSNIKCPEIPQLMNKNDVTFLIRMMLSEIVELAETVTDTTDEALDLVKSCFGVDLHSTFPTFENEQDKIAAQGDALVDMHYYALNVASKHGINLSKIFDAVHEANMNKRDPITGKFIRRLEDNKILKPPGRKSPDIVKILFP